MAFQKGNKLGGRTKGSKDRTSYPILYVAPAKKRVAHNKGKKCPTSKLTPAMREKQWKPGQSGNPLGGRIKSRGAILLTEAYKNILEERCLIPGFEGLTYAEAIAMGMSNAASRGESAAAKEIREATQGKLPEHLRLGDPEGKPLAVPVFNVSFVAPKDGQG